MRDDELLAHQGISLKKATETLRGKREYTHTLTEDLIDGCPIGGALQSSCWTCDYTDIIGYCCYPVDINAEIAAGRARPLLHDYEWSERQAHYEAIFFRNKNRELREQREQPVIISHRAVGKNKV